MFDLLFLHRHSPLMRRFVEWSSLGTTYLERAGPDDAALILETVTRHEGKESARIAAHWLERQPGAFVVCRRAGREVIGFCANLVLREPDPVDLAADPALAHAWELARRLAPIRPDEAMLYHRFVMDRATYQSDAAMNNMAATNCTTLWLSTPNLAWTLISIANEAFWRPMFTYLDFARAPEADFAVGDRRYAVFAHDWRVRSPAAWLELMGEREIADEADLASIEATPAAAPPLLVLSRPQFDEAIRQALRDLARPDRLAANPLVRSRVVAERSGPAPAASALRTLIAEAVAALAADPRDAKLERAVRRTYVEPATTQELAAEVLGLPFSTYRYQLNAGIRRVADWLWQRELHGTDD